jgi:ketosteroid isomerase-like protein
VFGAIANVKRPEIHKRLMLPATIAVLPPAIARFFFAVHGGVGPGPCAVLRLTLVNICVIIRPHRSAVPAITRDCAQGDWMKLSRFTTLLLAGSLLSASSASSRHRVNDRSMGEPAASVATAIAAVETEIRALDERQAQAWVVRDQAALERLWSPDFVLHAPSNQILTRDAVFREMKTPRLEMLSLERTVQRVTVFGDIAISMGVEHYRPKNGPNAGALHTQRYTNVWRREGDTWRKIARHANVLPLGATHQVPRPKPPNPQYTQRVSDVGCYLLAEVEFEELSEPVLWHLYTYPTIVEADAARSRNSIAV